MTMISRCLPRSLQTRFTISSGDSVNAPGVFAVSTRLVSPPASPFSRSLKAWKLVTTILAVPRSPRYSDGNDVEFLVVVVRVGRQEHAQPVADGDAGRDDQEGVGEPIVVRVAALVEHLPGDEHGHDDRFAAAGRHLARDAEQVRPGLGRLLPQVLLDPVFAVLGLLRDLGDEDERFQRLDLAEEQPAAEAVLGMPVFEQGAGDGGDVRPTRLAPLSPRVAGCG